MISSVSSLRSRTKGRAHSSSMGKLNLSFCFGVRSACRRTVTLALRIQVEASGADSMARGRSGEAVRRRRQRSDRVSAAWSAGGVRLGRAQNRERLTVIDVVTLDEAPAVDINDLTFHSPGTPEHIKSTDRLSEAFADFSRPGSLLR